MNGMKLIIAIVHDDDATKVVKELNKQGFRVTRMCSSGGFLKAGNTTLMVGVDEEGVDKVLSVIELKSKARKDLCRYNGIYVISDRGNRRRCNCICC